jgi:hypothetical protein
VIGIATTIARAAGPQCMVSSSRSTKRPSENSVNTSAISTSSITVWSLGSTLTTSVAARPMPSPTDSTEIDSTVPRITPESAAAVVSSAPISSRACPKPMSIPCLYAVEPAGALIWSQRRRA